MLSFCEGRYANPKRGEKSSFSGRTRLLGREPENGPLSPAVTICAAVKVEFRSRFVKWPYSSVWARRPAPEIVIVAAEAQRGRLRQPQQEIGEIESGVRGRLPAGAHLAGQQ